MTKYTRSTRQKLPLQKADSLDWGRATASKGIFCRISYDFIYAIIIEEYGIFGGAFIMLVYLVIFVQEYSVIRKCPYAFGAFLALALSFTLVIQAMANMAVNVNLFPVRRVLHCHW